MDQKFIMMKIAITGGIGSGKSFVCRVLGEHGIEVYDCDAAAKRLMRHDARLQVSLRQLVGKEVYDEEGKLQKPVLAKFLLESERHKRAVNDGVHPAVAHDFELSGLDWIECAILFDSGFIHRTHIDKVVCVTAPLEVRIQRVMNRDHIDRDKTVQWIGAQMSQEKVLAQSDYEIVNDGVEDVEAQVAKLLETISKTKIRI